MQLIVSYWYLLSTSINMRGTKKSYSVIANLNRAFLADKN